MQRISSRGVELQTATSNRWVWENIPYYEKDKWRGLLKQNWKILIVLPPTPTACFLLWPDVFDVAEDEAGEERGVEGQICKFQVEDQGWADRCQSFNRNHKENVISAIIILEGGFCCCSSCHFVAQRPDLRTSANKSEVISVAECISFRDYDSTRIKPALWKLLALMKMGGLHNEALHLAITIEAMFGQFAYIDLPVADVMSGVNHKLYTRCIKTSTHLLELLDCSCKPGCLYIIYRFRTVYSCAVATEQTNGEAFLEILEWT